MWLQLQYDSAPVHIGSLDSSAWVFGLLGAFYAVLGALYVILDGLVVKGAILQGELSWLRECLAPLHIVLVAHLKPDLQHQRQCLGKSYWHGVASMMVVMTCCAPNLACTKKAVLHSAGKNAGATERAIERAEAPFTLLSLGVVAALHELSSILYAQGSYQSQSVGPFLVCILRCVNIQYLPIQAEYSVPCMEVRAEMQNVFQACLTVR